MKDEKTKPASLLERIRKRQDNNSSKDINKIRLLFFLPFLIAAAVFLIMYFSK